MDPNNYPQQQPNPQNAPQANPQTLPTGQFDPSQFDFIMNPQQPQKKSLLPSDPKLKMIFLGLGVVSVAIILLIVIMNLFSGGNSSTESLVKITQQQNEIIRIATDGNRKAGSEKAKKLSTTTFLTVTTDQKALIDYLAKQKRKLKPSELSLLTDKKADKDLSDASSNGRYDEVFTQIMGEKLSKYQSSLKSSYGDTSKKGQEILNQSYNNVDLILKDNSLTAQ